MNATEQIAHEWLRKKYPKSEIVFSYNKTPDFVIDGRIGVEAKRGHLDRRGNTHVVATVTQINDINAYPESYILVVCDSKISTLGGRVLSNNIQTYGKLIIHWQKKSDGITTMRVSHDIVNRIAKQGHALETLNDVLERIVTAYEKQNPK